MTSGFKNWLEGIVDGDTKTAIFQKVTTTGLPARRGIRPHHPGRPYAHDPGDLGRGIYYDTNWNRARSYALSDMHVSKSVIKFDNPLVVTDHEAYAIANEFKTVRLPDTDIMKLHAQLPSSARMSDAITSELVKNAEKMTRALLAKGHDGLIAIHPNGNLEIVDYRPYR